MIIFKGYTEMEKDIVEITKMAGRIPFQVIREKLIASHGKKCGYCGSEMTFDNILQIDSYLPKSKYPQESGLENYVLSCPICNRIKADKEPIDDKGKVLILHPYKDDYWTEIQINKDGVAEGRTEAGKNTVQMMMLNRPELVSYRLDNIANFIETINDKHTSYEVYTYSINQIENLLKLDIEESELKEYFYRMIYANVIASMEAYLSKTIILIVLNNNDMFWKFVNKFDWNKEKVCIEDIKNTYDNMNIKVQTKLAEVIYHNLPKVKAMYKNILAVHILEDNDEMVFLSKAVNIRHDIVHRNGRKNNDGKKEDFHIISLKMIKNLIIHVNKLVENVEVQIK